MVSSVELRSANIDLGEPECVTITAKNGVFFAFYPTSDAERKEWVMAIGALMQVFQSHWKSHPMVPVFELMAARVTQLWSLSKSPTHIDTATKLSDTAMLLMIAYMWNSTRRQERIIERLTAFIQVIKVLISHACPEEITDALSSIAKQVVQHANLPFPSLQSSLSVNASNDPSQIALSQGRSSPAPTEYKSISFGPQKSSSKSNINDPDPASSYSQTITTITVPETPRTDSGLTPPISPSSSSTNLNLNSTSSNPFSAAQSPSTIASPIAGRRAHADLNGSSANLTPIGSSNGGSSKLSSPPSLSHSSPNIGAKDSDVMASSSRSQEMATPRSQGETPRDTHQETQQEIILRLVKDIRATFVKSVESFKSLNQKNFESTVVEAEQAFEVLKSSFNELLKPLESPTVVQRLRETPDKYLESWRHAVAVVKRAFEASDRTAAMQLLREALPAVGDEMGQASHVLCGSVFEAAQQLFAEQELKGAMALLFDCETSRIASFLHQVSQEGGLRNTSPSLSPHHSNGITSPHLTPRQDFRDHPNAVHYVPISTGQTVMSPTLDEFTDLVRKALLAAQTMTKICKNSFFDATTHEDHAKHLSILERLNAVVDKMIADSEGSTENAESDSQNVERTILLETLISIREYGDMSADVIETIADLDNNPRAALSTISPQQAMKSLAASRGSQQAFSSKLNSAQMRFSTATKQLCSELERLLELVPGVVFFDESKLSKEQLKARRKSMAPIAASTHFINHFNAEGSMSPTQSSKLEGEFSNLSIAAPAPTSPRSALAAHPLSSSSPLLPSFTVSDQETSPRSQGTEKMTWSEKIKPRASINNGDIPRLPTQFILGVTSNNTANPLSASAHSPRTPNSGSSSPGGPDSMQWRKSVKSRDDPVSPRTMSFSSTSPKMDNPLAASSPVGSASSPPSGNNYLQEALSDNTAKSSFRGAGVTGYEKSSSNAASSSNAPSPSTAKKSPTEMQTLTIAGVSIQYPLTENIWSETEEGNMRYLKASEAESDRSSANVTSPNSRAAAASKTQSSRDLGRPSASPSVLGSSARSGHASTKSDVPSGASSPGAAKGHTKSDSDSGAGGKLTASNGSQSSNGASPGSNRMRLSSEPLIASATLNRLIIKLTSESAVDVAFMKSFLATYRSFTTPEELWGKLLERYNVPKNNGDFSEESYKQQVTLPIHLRVANVLGMWLSTCYMDISDNVLLQVEYFINHTLATGEARGLQRKLKTAFEKAQSDKKLHEIQENAKFGRTRAGGADRAKAFKQVMMTARTARLDPFMFFNEEDIDPQLIAEQLTALDWSLFSKITNTELLNAHLMSKGTFQRLLLEVRRK